MHGDGIFGAGSKGRSAITPDGKDLINRVDGQAMAVLTKNFRAVWTSGQDGSDPLAGEIVVHLVKKVMEACCSSEVMGCFRTTVQNKSGRWDDLLNSSIDFGGYRRSSSRQGAPWKKDGIASFWQAVPGKKRRSAAFLITENGPINGFIKVAVFDTATANLQEQTGRIKFFRTDRGAEAAQTALIGKRLAFG